jgi:ABC-2 type transport system permease protein
MAKSFAAELLKLRKRPATWVLALIWVVIIAFSYFSTYAFVVNAPPPPEPPPGAEAPPPEMQEEMQAQHEAFNETLLESLYPQNLLANLFNGGTFQIGGALMLILGALVVGSEYGWGTLKTALTQRPGRLGVLLGKLLAFGAAILAFVLLGFATAALCGSTIALLEDAAVEWPALGELARGLGAGALILAVWGMMGFALATLFRGTALAIGLGLAWVLAVESLLANLPIESDSFENVRKAMPGENSFSLARSFGSPLPEEFTGPFEPLVDPEQAVWVLLAYAVGFILLSALLLRQRDVT